MNDSLLRTTALYRHHYGVQDQPAMFRAQHRKELALHHFVGTVRFFSQRSALIKAVVHAIDEYTEGPGSAMYSATEDGRFVLAHSTLASPPAALDSDATVILDLQVSNHIPLAVESPSLPSITLVLPLVRGSSLVGLVATGGKRDGTYYRKDEIEAFVRLAREVSAQLSALELAALAQCLRQLEVLAGPPKSEPPSASSTQTQCRTDTHSFQTQDYSRTPI